MLNEDEVFMREPSPPLSPFLYDKKIDTTHELAEWIVLASMNVVDKDGLHIMYMIPPYAAYQIARMMQIAKLKVPT